MPRLGPRDSWRCHRVTQIFSLFCQWTRGCFLFTLNGLSDENGMMFPPFQLLSAEWLPLSDCLPDGGHAFSSSVPRVVDAAGIAWVVGGVRALACFQLMRSNHGITHSVVRPDERWTSWGQVSLSSENLAVLQASMSFETFMVDPLTEFSRDLYEIHKLSHDSRPWPLSMVERR